MEWHKIYSAKYVGSDTDLKQNRVYTLLLTMVKGKWWITKHRLPYKLFDLMDWTEIENRICISAQINKRVN